MDILRNPIIHRHLLRFLMFLFVFVSVCFLYTFYLLFMCIVQLFVTLTFLMNDTLINWQCDK